jgi:hypothetical protein
LSDTFRLTVRRTGIVAALLATFAAPGATILAQSGIPAGNAAEALLTLPDEPGLLRGASNLNALFDPQGTPAKATATATGATLPEASRTEKYIQPGQTAPSLTAGDKVLLGLKDAVSPFAAIGWLASAGYEQALNGSPNYGTDRGAFGQRLGAAAIRDISEGVFSDSVMAPILHEDPRYYRMGPRRNFIVRLIYAGTRPILTRTDGGRTFPNLALLAGTAGGAALTNTYYPQLNHGTTQTMETFGGSLGGTAVGDVVSEFYDDVIHMFHKGH